MQTHVLSDYRPIATDTRGNCNAHLRLFNSTKTSCGMFYKQQSYYRYALQTKPRQSLHYRGFHTQIPAINRIFKDALPYISSLYKHEKPFIALWTRIEKDWPVNIAKQELKWKLWQFKILKSQIELSHRNHVPSGKHLTLYETLI